MDVSLIASLIFVITLILSVSVIYLFYEIPARKKAIKRRLEALREASLTSKPNDAESSILQEEVLSRVTFIHRLLLKFPLAAELHLFLQQAAVDLTPGRLILFCLLLVGSVTFVGMLLDVPAIAIVLLAFGSATIPFLAVAIRRHRRFLKFEEQFPEAIDFLARAVRAGHAFTTGLDLIATEMENPVAREFRKAYDQQNMGLPLREALRNLTRRMPLPDVQVFVTALTIQREAGGNLAEILDNLSYVVRERFKLMRQVKALTAQGRMTLYILIASPPIAGVFMYLLNAEYVSVLFEDPMGHQALMGGAVLQVIGFFIIRKIVEPKF